MKKDVLDPQGKVVSQTLKNMGYNGITNVRQGKYFELEIDTSTVDHARALAAEVADRLLANPVIESYRVEVE